MYETISKKLNALKTLFLSRSLKTNIEMHNNPDSNLNHQYSMPRLGSIFYA